MPASVLPEGVPATAIAAAASSLWIWKVSAEAAYPDAGAMVRARAPSSSARGAPPTGMVAPAVERMAALPVQPSEVFKEPPLPDDAMPS